MEIMPPVLMPIWMIIVMIIGILLVSAWLLRTFLVTRRDTSLEVGDIPMAPRERRQWGERLSEIAQRWDSGELLAVWEQPSFDREPESAAVEALNHAREVVTQW